MSNMKPNAVKGPIPPNTIRISIQYGEWVYVVDYPSAKMDSALSEFDDLAGRTIRELRGTMKELGTWKGDDVGARSMARYAREEGEYYLLAVASLWMFMNRPNPSDQARAEKALRALVEKDGGAWLIASTDANGEKWSFNLAPVSLARIGSRDGLPIFPALSTSYH